MLKIDSLFIIKNPKGKFSFVGKIPTKLCQIVPATRSAILRGRAFEKAPGRMYMFKFPVFETEQEAIEFCKKHQVEYKLPTK